MADLRKMFRQPDSAALIRTAVLLAVGVLMCSMLGIPGVLVLLVLGWPATATIHAEYGWSALALLIGGAAGMAFMLPADLAWLPFLWAAAGCAGIVVPGKTHYHSMILWGAMAALVVCAVLGALALRYPGETAAGFAQELIDLIGASEQRDSILLSAYQNGLASVDESLLPTVPQIPEEYTTLPQSVYTMFAEPALSEEAAKELLYSLRTSLEALFRVYMPQLIVSYLGLTVALCTVVPDEWLRRRGLNDNPLPQMDEWKLPPRMAIVAICGLIMSFLPYMVGSTVMSYAVTLCVGAATWAFMVQGAGLMAHLLKKHGTGRSMRYTIALVLAVLLPQVLEIMGIIDQVTSLRKRGDTE